MQARTQDDVATPAAATTPFSDFPFGGAVEAGDEAALLRAARENPANFAPLYDRYFTRIYAYCLRRADSPAEAEDLTSQVFICALKGLTSYRGGLAAAWLFRIARSVVANHYRSRRAGLAVDDMDETLATDDPPLLDGMLQEEEARRVRSSVNALPRDERDLIALRVDAGLSSDEIGQIMGMRAGAVRMKLHRVFKRLQKQLAEDAS